MITVSAGEIHILLFKICFPDFKPAIVFLKPLYAVFQPVGLSRFVPKVSVEPCVTNLFVDESFPSAIASFSDYAKVYAEASLGTLGKTIDFRC